MTATPPCPVSTSPPDGSAAQTRSVIEAVKLVACHVFNTADRDGQSVSMELVRTRLDGLREHPQGCCRLCVAAAKAAPADVYRAAKAWQWQTTATRLRALR